MMKGVKRMDLYPMIFKRKSFHKFRDTGTISQEELSALKDFIAKDMTPLDESIRTKIEIVPESETTCRRGAEYCVLFYSEEKQNYLNNIGYIGEQIDLWCASHDIGALWFGIGKVKEKQKDGLSYCIMIAIAKVSSESFRKDMFKAKRKELSEFWSGDTLNVAQIVRFTPSACNTQPWIVENTGEKLLVYRYKKPGKRGIMPILMVKYYNRIDIGIFLFMLELCLTHEGKAFERKLFADTVGDDVEKIQVAEYTLP